MNMYIWLCKDTGTMNLPLRLAVCSLDILCVNGTFCGVFRGVFRGSSLHIHRTFATCSLSVCYIIAIQKYGFCVAKVWFLACKKGVFGLQKYGFCNSKVWFLFLLCNSVHNQ